MDLKPNLIAAADMCAAGEDVNLDELSFLLRYAADELARSPAETSEEHQALLTAMRERLAARSELLGRPEHERERIRQAGYAELDELEDLLDGELRRRFPPETLSTPPSVRADGSRFDHERFRSGPTG